MGSPYLGHRYTLPRHLAKYVRNVVRNFNYGTPLLAQRNDTKRSIPSPSEVSEFKDIGVLGGGITGMASAYYLSEEFPHAKITLYESKPELGGWMRSKHVDVGDGKIIFEQGPRSLRPLANGVLALRLVSLPDCYT